MPSPVTSSLPERYRTALAAKHAPPAGWPAGDLMGSAQEVLSGAVSRQHADALPVEWTTWAHVRETDGRLYRGTWRDMTIALANQADAVYPHKLQCPGWAPVRFAGNRRADDAAEAIYALALDCDDHGDWTRTLSTLADLGLAYLAHRSPSHGVDGACKWRLVLALEHPLLGAPGKPLTSWRDLYTAARVVLGAVGVCWYDPSCSNPSRLWYPPVRVGGLPPREVVEHEGMALDLATLAAGVDRLASVPAPAALPLKPARPVGSRLRVALTPYERAEKWLACVEGAVQGAGGDQATFRVAAKLTRDFDLSAGEASALMAVWNLRCIPPWPAEALEKKIANARKYGSHVGGEALTQGPAGPMPETDGEVWEPPAVVLEPEPEGPRDEAGDPIKPGARAGSVKWARLSEKGNVVACRENTEAMLKHYGVRARYNLMTHEDEYEIAGFRGAADKRANTGVAQIREWARKHGLPAGEALTDQLCLIVADDAYHPVAEWIRSRPWDGVDRVSDLFGTLTLACDDQRAALMLRLFLAWCVTAAHAALIPSTTRVGVAAQLVLVLQGPQGVQKTRWVQALVPKGCEWAREGVMLDPSQRDSVQQATNVWIVELGELDATFRKADIAALKAHLTSRTDTYRAAYAHKSETRARRTVYAATVNERGMLHDDTGSRRFAVLPVLACDAAHEIDMQQFWAQMAAQPEEARYLVPEDERALLESNREHEATDPLADLCATYWEVDDREVPSWESLKSVLTLIDRDRQWTTADSRAIAKVMRDKWSVRTRRAKSSTQFAVRARAV